MHDVDFGSDESKKERLEEKPHDARDLYDVHLNRGSNGQIGSKMKSTTVYSSSINMVIDI